MYRIVAPWPGFEPGSGGRQPPILGRAILPRHPIPYKEGDLYLNFSFQEPKNELDREFMVLVV